ncbi:MAG: NADP-dependent oxidoreductase domain-containing protein [Lentinula lateritia]|uniref:Aryl-alcohol dehydrogenase n=1 Tax=Lentinula lateritia TaxID=40482 RepID=A0ABQ8VBZ2_9AGAR|nr:MAG: NADP-dependent oxidoreductase domain-containing protein [Lentinula lateritia]KAJ4480342.1 aryl-alcohol dehydrogenase [Lentinula lateritia]
MSIFQPAPPPATKLGVLRVLSPNAGVHVSPFCFGGMSIGDQWNGALGSMNKESSFKLLDSYFDMGGNFIDTANNYQDESSEQFIGEWMEQRGIRDQIVLATKYTTNFKRGNDSIAQKANYTGNNLKSMHISVEASLKKLRTSYIDLLYVHWWDYDTSVKEVMDGLHSLVMQGKVLYLGISDTPAWVVAQANEYARCTGKTPFVVYQGLWNILDRSFEREIIPMARSQGLALAPWGVLAQGKLRTDAEEQRRKENGENGRMMYPGKSWERDESETKISRALEKVASELGLGSNIGAVAIAYVMQKTPYVFPIIGGRKIEHLQENIKALDIWLSEEQIQFLEGILPFDPGFPHNMVGDGTKPFFAMLNAMSYKKVQAQQAIKPTD